MDMDLEYARFMSELEAVPSDPIEHSKLVGSNLAQQPSPQAKLPHPPIGTMAAASIHCGMSEIPTLAPPPGKPPALLQVLPATAPSRPLGLPPPLSAAPTPAVLSAPAQPPSQPSLNPPVHPLPALANPPHTSGSTFIGSQNGASSQAFNPALFNPASLREEILSEKRDGSKKKKPKDGALRAAGGETWIDDKMDFWPPNDFRIFVGNLGPEVNDDTLCKAFQHFPSYAKCRIVKDYKKNKAKGYGFVSFLDATEGIKALKQMNGKYIGNRPCQLKKSCHDVRNVPAEGKKRKAMLANPMERLTTKRMR